MILDKKEKQPAEVKDYPVNYADWLAESGDVLSNVSATVVCLTDPSNTALTVSSLTMAPTAVAVWLSGGTDGHKYKVSVNVTTAGGRVDQGELIMKVKEY